MHTIFSTTWLKYAELEKLNISYPYWKEKELIMILEADSTGQYNKPKLVGDFLDYVL